MALAGSGAVAIWHDIAPEGRDEFYAWHGEEHMPERAAIPGFVRGRRYGAVHGVPEYFNLYETLDASVLTGRAYLARLNSPTPWTVAAVKHFRSVARSLCEVAATAGRGEGGLIATFRYDVAEAATQAHRARMAERMVSLAREPGVAGAHLLVADPKASGIETAERKARSSGTDVPRWIVLLEWWGDEAPLLERCWSFTVDAAFGDASAPPAWSGYRLQNACSEASHRNGPWSTP